MQEMNVNTTLVYTTHAIDWWELFSSCRSKTMLILPLCQVFFCVCSFGTVRVPGCSKKECWFSPGCARKYLQSHTETTGRNEQYKVQRTPCLPMCLSLVLLCLLQCCVFPAAIILQESWKTLLENLWDQHLNHSFVVQITQSLERIIEKNNK